MANKGRRKRGNSTLSSPAPFHNRTGSPSPAHRPTKKAKESRTIYQAYSLGPNSFQSSPSSKIPPVESEELVLPGDLLVTHAVKLVHIISSSKIEQKVDQILAALANFSFIPPIRPNVVVLWAKAPVANKMMSIVGIVKRVIAESEGKWYQYNQVKASLVAQDKGGVKPEGCLETNKEDSSMDIDTEFEADVEDESTFETMKTPFERAIEDVPKVRAVPVMTIYLSRVRVESLRKSFT